jgi:hypothetical protein
MASRPLVENMDVSSVAVGDELSPSRPLTRERVEVEIAAAGISRASAADTLLPMVPLM